MNKNPLSFLKNAFSSVFGKLNWRSPPWVNYLCYKSKSSPQMFWGTSLLIIVILISGGYSLYWYKNLPKPVYTTAQITVPDITPNTEEGLFPNNLIIDFGIKNNGFINQSVAPINLIGKPITEGIEMSPKMPGTWMWNTDSQLVFTPSEDWPAGQKFTIRFANNFFAPSANLESHEYSFNTHPLTAKITEFKLYQDPVHVETRNAVATIEFNYPVNPQTLEKNTSLVYQTKSGSAGEALPFTFTFDKNKRLAYLHSETIKITDVARFIRLTLNKDITSSTNSGHLRQEQSQNLIIPSASDFLKVLSTTASIIRNDKDRPEQVLTVETSLGINESEFNKSVHFYLLPKDRPATVAEAAQENYQWQNPGEVTEAILSLSTPLTKEAIPTEQNYSSLHSFKFKSEAPRYIYIKIDKGMRGFGDFTLGNTYAAVIPVPPIPKEISFLHKGSLLALSGEKKLSVLIRGVPAVKFDFARVLPENINQLVTQTQGDFNNPFFINPSFNQQNISQISSEIQEFNVSDVTKQQYTALDFSKYLTMNTNSMGPQGLFLLQATGWDVANNSPLDVKASRMILITDLALLVKDNQDGSHDVFVDSIAQGTPVTNATVTVLGKNGLPILSRISDAQGRVTFPSLKDFVDDREPTVYLAQLNNDVSFIPFNNANRQLNFSKFDIGGLYTYNQELHSLSAYLFSDRGIYRPGDTVHIGMIVKQAYAQPQPGGLPLQATVVDSRGTTIKDEKITLNDLGYMNLDFTTNSSSPTGQYMVNLYLVKDGYPQNLLGSTNIRVSEFLPDRMRITTSLSPNPSAGWSSPVGLKGEVTLWNLYGAPAADRKVSGKILLVPEKVQFDKYPDYVFVDPLLDPKKPPKVFTETLNDVKTNDKGEAEFDLNLERFEKATYQLTFFAEGFESEGGRSVTSQTKTLVSPQAYFVGYKPDGDLSFIKQNSARSINYIAVNPGLNKEEIKELKIQLVSLHPVTTLVKKADGTYQYQSVVQSTVISTSPFNISEQGTDYTLPTQQIGDFSLSILGKDNTVLNQLKFSVVGASQQPLAKNAELAIKLNKNEYLPNEEIEIQITAPYTGSGLITIERDKVYAAQWFKTDTTNSVQTIHIPADFQGDGYINVAFIRDWNSPEIFISPLSYSVVPFTVNHESHDIKIDLQTAEVARPGEPLTINYHTDKPGKIIVFAVDEGILQVARYETPDPLSFFFQKHALEVLTQQTVDQIMPKFIQDRELSAVGGDSGEEGMASRLNPFKRKSELPVAYWSGILDTDSSTHQVTYHVPDYFNGTLRVMAVAVSSDSVGSQETAAEIRGDFIINPNVPTFVAPGDEFEISSSVANNIKGSGEHALIQVNLSASPEIEIIGSPIQTLEIAEGREQTVHFKLKAKSLLGGAKLSFKASMGDKSSIMNATLSVRPAIPFSTYINSGKSEDSKKTLDIMQTLFPEYRKVNATASTSPMILVFGLQRYLDNYPYGCTEQLTSKALPLLAMNNQTGFGDETLQVHEKVNATIQMLSQRQMSSGGFSYWPGLGDNQGNDFSSVYAMHFLTEAKAQGFSVPGDLFSNGINYLKTLANQNVSDLDTARIQAYAIYILTRNEIVTTNYLANLQLYLEKDKTKAWQSDITTAYIAASYQLLQSNAEANQLIGLYQPQTKQAYIADFYSSAIADAQYLYLVAKHFPNLLPQVGNELLTRLVQAINNNEINTVLSGFTSLALGAYHQAPSNESASPLTITQIRTDNKEINVPVTQTDYQKTDIDSDVLKIRFNNPEKKTYFYQLIQSGFNREIPNTPLKQGLEIFREYRDPKGNVINSTSLGSEIEVHIQIRALDNDYLSNIAIEDLLPGGFEVVTDSVKNNTMDYVDIREDRVNFFGGVESAAKEIVYKIKAVNIGKYIVPPAYAESMYNPNTKAQGVSSVITVTETP
ncbi:alpha-2-macroglobulin [Fluoribacter dumoffii]|uniref:alpha-2-macroglobulin n=1 Tax=Fluoribacter dumoffii TaxID=463 RepID=UPI00224497AB|nr:alpha-2-macroglobulin [Fluoribacter dumoffii]MCW8418666.1 alpha-2-macroglobulin [Fluoribacter dumoffii]MCW8453490.1 alpha-2-macroglobulin [Fluoribacter dumoffii]MCW8459290.1 alpha-2-macroglobulin [Fluoribacter dumoffii]MCW8482649.1 alpha-2-macroglobulin [Fluoribacter dumoffii]